MGSCLAGEACAFSHDQLLSALDESSKSQSVLEKFVSGRKDGVNTSSNPPREERWSNNITRLEFSNYAELKFLAKGSARRPDDMILSTGVPHTLGIVISAHCLFMALDQNQRRSISQRETMKLL